MNANNLLLLLTLIERFATSLVKVSELIRVAQAEGRDVTAAELDALDAEFDGALSSVLAAIAAKKEHPGS